MFKHFLEWMWRNEEVQSFINWLRAHNVQLPREKRAGFFGLDLYGMGSSIRAVINYLNRADPETTQVARKKPWVPRAMGGGPSILWSGGS